jgi:nitrogen-specific signal transduction histidine kinase
MDSPRRLAHDLNNITFVIYGYAQRLEEAIAKTDPLQQDVQAILGEIPRLTAAVDRIRAFEEPSDQGENLLVDSKRQ